jgi:hypothetical protein
MPDEREQPQQIVIAPPPPDADKMPRRLEQSWLFAICLFVLAVGLIILAMWLVGQMWTEMDEQAEDARSGQAVDFHPVRPLAYLVALEG